MTTKRRMAVTPRRPRNPYESRAFTISGRVQAGAAKNLAPSHKVDAYVRSSGLDVLVGSAISGRDGGYRIRLLLNVPTSTRLPQGELVLRVLDSSANTIAESKPQKLRRLRSEIDLLLCGEADRASPELEQTRARIEPHLNGKTLDGLHASDLSALAKASGEPAARIGKLTRAAKLASAIDVPVAASYGLLSVRES